MLNEVDDTHISYSVSLALYEMGELYFCNYIVWEIKS